MSSSARAASLLASAMDVAYAGDDEMAITVHNTNGSAFTVAGGTSVETRHAEDVPERDPIDFDPKDLGTLLDYLARLLTTPKPKGAISVRVPDPERGGHITWVWSLATFAPLRFEEAVKDFPGIDVPSTLRAYGCITDDGAPTPLTPITDRVVMTLVPRHY
ncbi:hypothetical protein [Streptomyces sp. 11x1]|uniref:hypothetical protein n=1 Tax=Streptomyces sp. 11x1 TaxID=3038642 RepID=UPI0029306FC1|nr:hypothetical protein [Streptomyces sp. 11x1]WNZ14886.1 hypothetical protein P8T65_46470 [Streptomyces sp. 11x1]